MGFVPARLTAKGGPTLDKQSISLTTASILGKRNIIVMPDPGLRCLGHKYCIPDSHKAQGMIAAIMCFGKP